MPKATQKGQIYVVALPIGNHLDISARAIEILSKVDVIAAEDTRTFMRMAHQLSLPDIRVVAHHDHNEVDSTAGLLSLLNEGKSIALVSDAGTPGISDPGYRLTKKAFEEGFEIKPIPGASSITAVLSVCPIGGNTFFFIGFAPSRSEQRKTFFENAHKSVAQKIVFFESPHRVIDSLEDLKTVFGDEELFMGRELTKEYEEFFYGTVSSCIEKLKASKPLGEFVFVIKNTEASDLSPTEIEEKIKELIEQQTSTSDIVQSLQKQSTLSHKELYNLVLKHRK